MCEYRRWREQSKETKKIVKKLVKNGQLDLEANGGWVMHDEAAPHYSTMLDQTAFGHKFLLKEFGISVETIGLPQRHRMLQDGYGGPGGFFFENDSPIKDDPYLHDNNVCERIKTFVDHSLERAKHTKGNHVFWPMGTDFQYQNAHRWFKNLDKLIHYANQEGRVNMFYSTLGQYTDLKLQDKSLKWSVKTDDFFPYADQPNGYWSGYFSSRPALKRYVRVANSLLQSVRQLEVWAGAKSTRVNHLVATVGLSLHHDGITGTEKQKVSDDYAQRLGEGVGNGHWRLNELLDTTVDFCFLANVSICNRSTTSDPFTFVVYNPLAVAHSYTIELPIIAKNAVVELSNGTAVPSVVVPFVPVYSQPIANTAPHQLVVQAHVPPLSWLVYHVTFPKASSSEESTNGWDVVTESIMSAENEFVRVEVNTVTGSLVSLTNKATQTIVNVTSSLLYYQAYGKQGDSCSSGAYLFHPNTSAVHNLPSVTSFKCQKTALLAACVFEFGTWGSLQYKLRAWDHSVVVEWTKTWYTDSNGLEFVKRVRDYRETWNLTLHNEEEKVAANYVPITIATYIRDKSNQFNVITDRAQGAASLKDGKIQFSLYLGILV
ncbi:hypothetical protein DYB37_006336 [Aphanomyces astaci]|uniref:Alpha-mannosidase n=1 Tax=Aphanomyces astaci TaxID=112090 RepID=A0A418E7F2_APHAT|nr:hypothetical protein DYB37_006336 [Aphanomyces astaci]